MNEFDALGYWSEAPQYKHYAAMSEYFRHDLVVDFKTHFIVTRARRSDDGAWFKAPSDPWFVIDSRFYSNLWSY